MTAAPRKYLDADRVEVNPQWLEWRDEQTRDAVEAAPQIFAYRGIDPAVYFPAAYDKDIPEEGAWILVLEEPFTEMRARFRVPLLSMWRARPHVLDGGTVVLGRRNRPIRLRPHQAVITTPGGDLHLWPHEYALAGDPYGLMSCEGAAIHTLGGEPLLDDEQLFYLMSRGVPYQEAVLLMIDQVKATNYVYVTFPEEVTAALEGVSQPLWRHMART